MTPFNAEIAFDAVSIGFGAGDRFRVRIRTMKDDGNAIPDQILTATTVAVGTHDEAPSASNADQ